jgi:lambda family phage portal protein
MNFIDRVIDFVSPTAGNARRAERLRADGYAMAELEMRAYAGAKESRGWDDWNPTGTGANTEIGSSLIKMRNRVRQLYRDNGIANNIINLLVVNLVGDGITATFEGGASARRNKRWDMWFGSTQCDADGIYDGYGLQALSTRIMAEAGGVIIRRRWRSPFDYPDLAVPMQLQVLEPDFIDLQKNGANPDNGNLIIQGIEFDRTNPSKRVAFWMYREHPGENSVVPMSGLSSIRVDAADVIYMFRKERNNTHGISWLHAAVPHIKHFDDYVETLELKAKIENCFTLFIEDDGSTDMPGAAPKKRQDFKAQPGMVRYLSKGQKITAFNPSDSGGHTMLLQNFVRMISVSVGIPYDLVWSDLTGANYSSLRVGSHSFRQRISQAQWHILVPNIVEIPARWFDEAGDRAGYWAVGKYTLSVTMPKVIAIDPKKDGDAEVRDMENGLLTWADGVRSRGVNPTKQRAALKKEIAEWEADGMQHPMARATVVAKNAATPDTAPKDGKPPDEGDPEEKDEAA